MVAQARPDYLDVNPAGIPQALKDRTQWVAWRAEQRGGKWTKVPINPQTGERADSTDPATWGTFVAALAHADKHKLPGIGYVFSADDPYTGIDLDKCTSNTVDAGLTVVAQTIIGEIDSYAEETPSGTGIHIICEATVPQGKGRKNTKHGIEVYDRARFFTMTGHTLVASPSTPQPRQEALMELHQRLFPVTPVNDDTPPPRPAVPPPDDQALINRAHRAKNAAGFARLWNGDTAGHHGDDSSADLALCNHLAFWAGPDPSRIDRLFRASRLYRTKWEREDYRNRTIEKALQGRADFYDWSERGPENGPTFRIVGDDEEPPTPEGEGGAPSTNPNDYDLTDTGNAELFAAVYAHKFRYDHRRGAWLDWRGHWWATDDVGEARWTSKTIATLRLRAAAEIEDEKQRKVALKWAFTSQAKGRRDALLDQASIEPALRTNGTEWDTDHFLLGVANGVVDLETGVLRPGHPRDRITMHSPIAFDPDAKAPRWERFLSEVFRDDRPIIEYVQRFAGYSLTGDISEHKLLICWGKGSNGKSTLLSTLAHIAGDYGYSMPFSTVEAQRNNGGPTNDLAALDGRRLVTASEVNEGQPLNEARIKALTGGDAITARFLNKEFFTFRPRAKFWLAVNHKPTIGDDSKGLWRRIDMVPFLASFEGAQVNKHLDRELLEEASGILAWMVRGCLDWRANGLGQPSAVVDATREYQRESDPLGAFLEQCCVKGQMQAVRGNVLYHAYLDWANTEGIRNTELITNTRFGRLLGDRYEKTRDRQGVTYKGIGISSEWQESIKQAPRFSA